MILLKVAVVGLIAALSQEARAAPKELKVVNGETASAGEFAFLASLYFLGVHECGATILNEQWLLTAAHCIYDRTPSDFQVRAGSNNWKEGGTLHSVSEMEYHAEYINDLNYPNDIAIVKVTPPLTMSELVQPVVLAEAGTDVLNATASVIAGWGATYPGSGPSDEMQRVDVTAFSDDECLLNYPEGPQPTVETICAGGGGIGVCRGDSGGPLLVDGAQVGLTSWGRNPCAEIPAIFTQISYFRDWILERTGA